MLCCLIAGRRCLNNRVNHLRLNRFGTRLLLNSCRRSFFHNNYALFLCFCLDFFLSKLHKANGFSLLDRLLRSLVIQHIHFMFQTDQAAGTDKFLPILVAFLADKVLAHIVRLSKHLDYAAGNFNLECATGRRTHNGKGLSSRSRSDLLLLAFVDTACLLIEFTQVFDIIGRQCKNKAVLTSVNDRGRLSGNFFTANKVLDILCNHDLHTVIFTDTLCQLEHEIQRHREFCIDKDVRLINNNHDLTLKAIFCVIIPVFNDLVIDVL